MPVVAAYWHLKSSVLMWSLAVMPLLPKWCFYLSVSTKTSKSMTSSFKIDWTDLIPVSVCFCYCSFSLVRIVWTTEFCWYRRRSGERRTSHCSAAVLSLRFYNASLRAIVRMNTLSNKLLCDPSAVTLCTRTLKPAHRRVTVCALAHTDQTWG